MKYILLLSTFLFLSIPLQAISEIESFDLYEGDNHGDFKDNFVVYLSDGSRWKVHPDETERLREWKIGESIDIHLRTSFYWFKREHKFFLKNHNRGESIKAMIVHYGEEPLRIVNTLDSFHTEYRANIHNGVDLKGNLYTYVTYDPYIVQTRNIFLSDGSQGIVRHHLDKFILGAKVYIGSRETGDDSKCIIITGKEREAVWDNLEGERYP